MFDAKREAAIDRQRYQAARAALAARMEYEHYQAARAQRSEEREPEDLRRCEFSDEWRIVVRRDACAPPWRRYQWNVTSTARRPHTGTSRWSWLALWRARSEVRAEDYYTGRVERHETIVISRSVARP